MKGLYVITDCARLPTDPLLSITEQVLRAGITALQYRDKSADPVKRTREALALHTLCRDYDCLFIINDDVQLARDTGSDGVHLGQGDCSCKAAREALGTGAIIGVSCYNSLARAQAAAQQGADYIAFGSFYPTSSKHNTARAETGIIEQAKAGLSLPVAVIGGITPANCTTLLKHGADLLAVISSVYQAEDPYSTVKKFNQIIGVAK